MGGVAKQKYEIGGRGKTWGAEVRLGRARVRPFNRDHHHGVDHLDGLSTKMVIENMD